MRRSPSRMAALRENDRLKETQRQYAEKQKTGICPGSRLSQVSPHAGTYACFSHIPVYSGESSAESSSSFSPLEEMTSLYQ